MQSLSEVRGMKHRGSWRAPPPVIISHFFAVLEADWEEAQRIQQTDREKAQWDSDAKRRSAVSDVSGSHEH